MKKNIRYFIWLSFLVAVVFCFFRKEYYYYYISKEDIGNISFLKVMSDGNIIVSGEGKSYIQKFWKKIKLEYEVIEKIVKSSKSYYIVKSPIGMYGVVDGKLNEVLEINFQEVINIPFADNYIVKSNGKYFLYNVKGKKQSKGYDFITIIPQYKTIKVKNGNKFGVIDDKGNEILSPQYDEILAFKYGKYLVKSEDKYGVVEEKNKVVIPIENSEVYFSEKNYLLKKDGKYILNDGIVDIQRAYPTLDEVVVVDKDGGFAVLDLQNLNLTGEVFNEISNEFDDYLIVGNGNGYGIVDKYKITAGVRYKYDYVEKVGKNSFKVGNVEAGTLKLLVGEKNITEEGYDDFINLYNDEYFLGVMDNKLELIDKNGKKLKSLSRKNLLYYDNESIVTEVDGKLQILKFRK